MSTDKAHELLAAAQLAPGEGILDGVARIEALLAPWVDPETGEQRVTPRPPTHWMPLPHHPEWKPDGWQAQKQRA